MYRAAPVLCLFFLAACSEQRDSCITTPVPSTLLHEILCGIDEGPQGICLAEVDNGF